MSIWDHFLLVLLVELHWSDRVKFFDLPIF